MESKQSFLIGCIILLPLLGAVVNGFLGAIPWKNFPRIKANVSGIIASATVLVSFLLSCFYFFKLNSSGAIYYEHLAFSWIDVGNFKIPMKFLFDNLSGLLCLIITGVGFLIHVYSIGYMHDDENPQRYFCYLNLFTASMLTLVLGANLPILFIGWEGVGLCSYLLIGFWYEDIEKAKAGKKAFVVNRIGDLGFLLGIFLLFTTFQTVDFYSLKSMTNGMSPDVGFGVISVACLLLFVGATGKSAQIPLFVWLPDAMAGPTPVSALIHAATMVTAGVYLCCRLGFMYTLAPTVSAVIAIVAALTAIVAATIAIVQNDIKKVLAYSTVSQLGYMFLAVGVGAYWVAVFHLMTHAFFKALMFLGSGSVIHAMGGEQDMRKMGGLDKYMPVTSKTFLIGTAAISGVPLFSGFFSKDEILWQTFSSPLGGPVLYFVGLLTAGLTATYMTRLYCMTFLGENRSSKEVRDHLHESPTVMTVPLMVLAFLSVFGGFLGFPHFIGGDVFPNWLSHFLEPIVPAALGHGSHALEWGLLLGSIAVAGSMIFATYTYYTKYYYGSQKSKSFKIILPKSIEQFLYNTYYINEIYEKLIVKPIGAIASILWSVVDVIFIDGLVLLTAKITRVCGSFLRIVQTGVIEHYLLSVALGTILLAAMVLLTVTI